MPQNAPDPNPTNLHKLTNTACPRKRKCRSRFPSFCPLRFLAFIASSYARLFQLLQASLVAPSLSQSDLPKLRKKATNNSKGWPPIWGCKNQRAHGPARGSSPVGRAFPRPPYKVFFSPSYLRAALTSTWAAWLSHGSLPQSAKEPSKLANSQYTLNVGHPFRRSNDANGDHTVLLRCPPRVLNPM